MKRHVQVALMGHVEWLRDRLMSVPVHQLTDLRKGTRTEAGRGIPPYVLSHAVTFLADNRDLPRFKRFLSQLPKMDVWTAQNLRNPRDYHLTLRTLLLDWLQQHPDLTAEQCVYVLSWVRRQLPKFDEESSSSQSDSRQGKPLPPPSPTDLALLQEARLAPPGQQRFSSASGAGAGNRDGRGKHPSTGLGAFAAAFEKAQQRKK